MKAATSIAFDDLRGRAGSVVVSKGRTGLVVKPRTTSKNPRTTPQQAVRSHFSKAASTFKNLTTTQLAAWQAYALSIDKVDPVSGQTYHPTAINAFLALAAKFLQNNPGGTIPVTPPSSAFTGDTITLSVTPGTGQVTFTASAGNAIGVTTELLLQRLVSKNRTPDPRAYRSKGFNFFTSGTLNKVVTVQPGYYAAAYRFVNTSTGQATVLQTLPVQQVTLALAKGGKDTAKAA